MADIRAFWDDFVVDPFPDQTVSIAPRTLIIVYTISIYFSSFPWEAFILFLLLNEKENFEHMPLFQWEIWVRDFFEETHG
tara:strand:+ start:4089 stop:4328 length:240 start_codon:yes stop_codon:yes gene_type:complete